MPFMKGRAPVRRTLKYLEGGALQLKERVRVLTLNYNTAGERHEGAREFVFWRMPQLQFLNPNVQVATFKNMTPSPFVRCYLDGGRQMLIDIDNKSQEEIMQHLIRVVGKSQETLEGEALKQQIIDSPANFGVGCDRSCICEVRGQVPCPGAIPLPKIMRGKYRHET